MTSEEKYQKHIERKGNITREEFHKRKNDKRAMFGYGLIAVGVLFIAKKSGIIPSEIAHYIFSWASLLIGLGLLNIFVKKNLRAGLILTSIGLIWLTFKVVEVPVDLKGMMWPIIAVVVGVLMVTVKNRHKSLGSNENTEHEIDMLTLFGGGNRKITSDQFLGGKVTSIFGGSEIDLTGAKLKEEQCVIDAFTMFGGVEISVPRGWEVQVDVVSIFGGFNDKRGPVEYNTEEGKKVLIIKGFAIFGGGEVKSY
ncbi:MAG: LiaF transmembrane domain-containing protein [Vicingaceae bacterium]